MSDNNKIISLDSASKISNENKKSGLKVIMCHGAFDLMHTGHIRYLQRASKEGDLLIVTVTADAFINKGPGRPIFTQNLRAENLSALMCVDYVVIIEDVTAVDAINKIKPYLYVKGVEYKEAEDDLTGNIVLEKKAVEVNGGSIFFSEEITFSSSSLLNAHFSVFTKETKDYLTEFSYKYKIEDIFNKIDSLAKLKVVVIGDAIIDQYHYVSTLGQTGKGNVLAVQHLSEEQFAGGALAVANHVSRFAREVVLVTGLGDYNSHENFIRSKLENNISLEIGYFKDAPTVTKRRFLDNDLNKFFEIYFYKEQPILEKNGEQINKWLEENLENYDLVIAADFGNGFINSNMISILNKKSKFLAVNTQINSGNRGYHVITRYPKADFISLNEPELRLSAHNKNNSIEYLSKKIANSLNSKYLSTTRGTKGVLMYDSVSDKFNAVPALSSKVVDRIGAGDAYLSIASLCLVKGISFEISNFIGSVAAAMDVQIVCNRKPILALDLKKYVTTLLK
jgi:rfaE bifunctional protein nucleotidyltransferase chain/domain